MSRLHPHTGQRVVGGDHRRARRGQVDAHRRAGRVHARRRPRGRRARGRPEQPVQRRRDPRRPGAHAAALDRPERLHPVDGLARSPGRPRGRDAAVDPGARRGRQGVGRRGDGRRRAGRGGDREPGRHDGRGREPRLGRRGAGRQGGTARDRRHLRRQQGRPAGRRRDGQRPRGDARPVGRPRLEAADRAHGRDRPARASTSCGRRSQAHRASLESNGAIAEAATGPPGRRAARARGRAAAAAQWRRRVGRAVRRAGRRRRVAERPIRTPRSTRCSPSLEPRIPSPSGWPTPRAAGSPTSTARSRSCRRPGRRATRWSRSPATTCSPPTSTPTRSRRGGRPASCRLPFAPASLVWLAERLGRRPLTHDVLLVADRRRLGRARRGWSATTALVHPRVDEAAGFRAIERDLDRRSAAAW